MLRKFTLRNYRNFKDEITIDFGITAGYQFSTDCITDGIISKMLIYGRNATGKTNLGKALMDMYVSVFGGVRYLDNGNYLNGDSSEDSASFTYEFRFDDRELVYRYARLSNKELKSEELIIDKKTIFKCNFENKEFEFSDLKYINAETANTDRYLQSINGAGDGEIQESRLPFLRWLINNVALSKDSLLMKLYDYVGKMILITSGNTSYFKRPGTVFYAALEDEDRLKDLEDFLNEMGVEYRLVLKKFPDGNRELYFKHERLVPFYKTASSGTLALVDLYRRLIPANQTPSFVYLDGFDAFYHYEMAEKVIIFFKKKYPKCQIIMTSHNTNLMTNRLMRPDCLFILSKEGTLIALCNATERELREGHNLEKMYISGEFERYE